VAPSVAAPRDTNLSDASGLSVEGTIHRHALSLHGLSADLRTRNVKSAHPAGRLRESNIKCLHASALMTEMDLPSLQLQSCSHLSLEWHDYISRFFLLL